MIIDDIRKLAVCLPFAETGHGLEQTQAALIALADIAEVMRRMSEWDQFRPPMSGDHAHWKREIDTALAKLEAIKL